MQPLMFCLFFFNPHHFIVPFEILQIWRQASVSAVFEIRGLFCLGRGIRDPELLWVRNIVASCWIIFCDCTDVSLRWVDGMRWRQALWWKAEIYRPDEGINIHLCIWLSFSFRSHKNDRWSAHLYFLTMQTVTLGEVCFFFFFELAEHFWSSISAPPLLTGEGPFSCFYTSGG